ncbi:hypothetical protein CHGG_07638 [Chaetomium globosum CBS 148.51]|uniref:Uncharacterized protein n=1 Tax=Chaetomium globosum (strain ATCC 6205 / CBS 148.51 / DSM 1962 / NBRC 6347 / NRRL 1970) TaxID=306901 RepID=Q2GWL6_CHAGB|nr:uncharacterized protein CHGG_07638 [Chaetomium globosum CBS 148.51]EAQ86385.1 hypothetical protein CHGG_07638 [Chaetomium globosum CBS 148.51]
MVEGANQEWSKDQEPIAIIGLSCKFAGDAANPQGLWKMLAEGRDAWSEIPTSRFDPKGVYHPDAQKLSTTHVKGAHFIEEDIGLFDAAFFNYSAETASALDPQYRIQLESAYEALENAGLSMSQVAGTNTSVYAGIYTHDYHDGLMRDEEKLPRFLLIGTMAAMASNRISHFFDLRGPSMTIDTGCSTALVALHQAVLGLRAREADMSIVGGCNLMLAADMFKMFSSLGLVGPDGRSYSFDSRANGYGRGEGVGTVVIKRLSDALAAGDPIRAVIRDTYLNQDGKTETITSPSQAAQEALIRECYRRAGLSPQGTQYFEAHGTGTPAGDPIEARAIAAVLGGGRTEKLRIGSVKTNIGHTEAASGLAGLIKVVLALEKGQIPPSVNFKEPNPQLKLDEWGLKVATELEPWPATNGEPRRASVNNFGYGGTNSHVILEDAGRWAPQPLIKAPPSTQAEAQSDVLVFYGRDEQACQRIVANTQEYLRNRKLENPAMSAGEILSLIKSLAWTLSMRRSRFPWVSAHVATYSDDLDQVIRSLDAPQFKPVRIPSRAPRIGMVFTGQGAQWYAMGRRLIHVFPIFRSTIYTAQHFLREFGADWSLIEELNRDAETSRVNTTALSIPVCVAVQIALVRLLRFLGISPSAVTSHSSGEIAAAYTVGALTLRQAMAAAYYRSAMAADKTLMNASGGGPKGAMVAVGVGSEAAQEFLDRVASTNGKAVVACINSPSSVTIAGDEAAVQQVEDLAKGDGVFARRLRVDTGYHSHHMMPIAEPYRQALRQALSSNNQTSHNETDPATAGIPEGAPWAKQYLAALSAALEAEAQTLRDEGPIAFSSPVTGGRITELSQLADPEHWVGSLLQPVQFVDAFTDMVLGDMDESGTSVDVVLEVGPHTALGGPIKEILAEAEFEGVDVAYMGCLVRNEDSHDNLRAAALNLLRRGAPVHLEQLAFPWGRWPFLGESGYTRRVDPEDLFAELRMQGVHHGPMFQNTTSIVQDGRSKEPRCVTTIEVADVGTKHVVHPTTLDSVIISSYAALSGSGASNDSAMLPQSIPEALGLEPHGHDGPATPFMCNTKAPRQDAQGSEAHISVVDGAEAVIEVQGFVCQSLGQSAAVDAEEKQPLDQGAVRQGRLGARRCSVPGSARRDIRREEKVLTEQDVANLAPHHVKFHTWMKDTLDAAAARRLGADSHTWTSDDPQKRQQYTTLAATKSVDGELMCRLGPHFVPVMRGEKAPLEIMMEDQLLYKYYANALRFRPGFVQFAALLRAVAHKNPHPDKEPGPLYDTWHFTDVSSAFFEAARSEFGAWSNFMEFDQLDIEKSPESQGFNLASYDIVVACQVLHATKSMARTMDHVHKLMKPGATLLLMETTHDQLDLGFIFGLLPGWWLSEEPERHSSPSLSIPMWDRVLKGAGFGGIDVEIHDYENDDDMYAISSMLATASPRQFKLASDSVIVVTSDKAPPPSNWLQSLRESIAKVTGGALPAVQPLEAPSATAETYNTKICVFVGEIEQSILHTLDSASLRSVKTMATACKGLLWVTRGAAVECVDPNKALVTGFLRSLRSEYVGRYFPTLDLDPQTPVWSESGIAAIAHVLQTSLGTADDVYSIMAEPAPVDNEFAVRDGLILVPRLRKDLARNKMLTPEAPDWTMPESIPEAPLFQEQRPLRLKAGVPGLLDTLVFADDDEDISGDADTVEIEPRAYGLNFRDVMVAMGQLRERVMGLECAGIITRVGSEAAAQGFAVGDRVMALLIGPFANRARVSWHGVAHMPEGMTFDDAASLPMIFSTAYVGLVDIANLRPGQSVLIHAAAGGVGQAAIMLAKDYLGAEVYATVGSQEKRDLLTREYGIPAERIFNSRDASFAPAVLAATGGRGVDVVLNSLAGPLLQAGFDVLAPFGHFVEIGKRDLEGNSLLEMATFSQVASFTSLDMMSLLRERGTHAHRVLSEVARLAGRKVIEPIHPVTVFPMQQVSRAFRLLQTGKHTGKVVLSVAPDEQVRVLPRAPAPKLRPDASYLLVGGVGGLGRSIAHWMMDHGARNLILLSRNASKQNAGTFITQLREAGCRVVAISCDVASEQSLTRALDRCKNEEGLPPIRGVIQGAMVLKDSILEQMTLDDWQTAIRPKVAGSWNLHSNFTQRGSLDFFVMLSSLSCILGLASQANYAAGGSYQDALARWRQASGLPAVSIDIGIVRGVGYVAESRAVSERVRKPGQMLVLPEDSVLRAIGAAVLHPLEQPQVLLGLNSGPGPQWDPTSESQMGRDARFVPLKYRRPTGAQAAGQQLGDADVKPLSAQLQEAGSRDEATRLVGDAIASKLGDIFMIPIDDIDLAKSPALHGVDSLVAVELRNMLMLQAAADISIFSIMQSASLGALASDVVAKSSHVEIAAGA